MSGSQPSDLPRQRDRPRPQALEARPHAARQPGVTRTAASTHAASPSAAGRLAHDRPGAR